MSDSFNVTKKMRISQFARVYHFVWVWVTVILIIQPLWIEDAALPLRIDCHLDYDEIDQERCTKRGCIWDEKPHTEIPSCYFNLSQIGYRLSETSKQIADKPLKLTNSSVEVSLDLLSSSKISVPKLALFDKLVISFTPITESILRFQIKDPANANRYQVPIQDTFPLLTSHQPLSDKLSYSVQIGSSEHFGFKVVRSDTNEVIWDSTFGGGLLYSDQFLQIATHLSTKLLYGMGENTHTSYLHDLNYKTWPLFAFDQPPDDLERNSYGVHPILMLLEPKTGTANGIFFLNSNAMEYSLTPDPSIAYKTSGGVLDFFIFVGKHPEDVVQQYLSLIGRPMMPPFWGLGFQLSRYGYKDTAQVKRVIERNKKHNIPVDVYYVDIDYMDVFDDFTYDNKSFADLPALIEQTRKEMDLKWTFIIDAAIQGNNPKYTTFDEGYKEDLYVRWDSSIAKADRKNGDAPGDRDVFYGRVWPRGPSSFPDFFKNGTEKWWEKHLRSFHNEFAYDGIWIDMNEPANFDNTFEVCPTRDCFMSVCPHNKYDFPDVKLKAVWVHNRTENRLSYRTLCLATRQGEHNEFLHYDVHSLYALTEAKQTNQALANILGRRSLILSRSSYVSAGRYTAHWTGDNTSKWSHLRRSVLQLFEFNLFGIPWVGADICGFQNEVTPELCLRWSQLGAFYPFSRNHNDIPNKVDQDPGVWIEYGHPEVTEAARVSLQFRYEHLHYYYTLFYLSHTIGETVIRPLFHEFPTDANTHKIEEQFMVGRSISVAPFLYENQHNRTVYLPNATQWYDLNGQSFSDHLMVEDDGKIAPVFFRAGSIIPVAITNGVPIRNTKHMRQLPLRLDIYSSQHSASFGTLYWDDGETLNSIENGVYNYYRFELKENVIDIRAIHSGYTNESILIDQIQIFGQSTQKTLSWTTEASTHKNVSATVAKLFISFSALKLNLTSLKMNDKMQMTLK